MLGREVLRAKIGSRLIVSDGVRIMTEAAWITAFGPDAARRGEGVAPDSSVVPDAGMAGDALPEAEDLTMEP